MPKRNRSLRRRDPLRVRVLELLTIAGKQAACFNARIELVLEDQAFPLSYLTAAVREKRLSPAQAMLVPAWAVSNDIEDENPTTEVVTLAELASTLDHIFQAKMEAINPKTGAASTLRQAAEAGPINLLQEINDATQTPS